MTDVRFEILNYLRKKSDVNLQEYLDFKGINEDVYRIKVAELDRDKLIIGKMDCLNISIQGIRYLEDIEKIQLEKEMYSSLIEELKDIKKSKRANNIMLYANFGFAVINVIVLLISLSKV